MKRCYRQLVDELILVCIGFPMDFLMDQQNTHRNCRFFHLYLNHNKFEQNNQWLFLRLRLLEIQNGFEFVPATF